MPNVAGFVIFGAPPVTSAAQFPEAFLPNPAMSYTGRVKLSESEAQVFACAFLAPASTLPTSEFVSDIRALGRGAVQLITGAGHVPQQEQPQQFAALLTDVIGDLSR